MLCRAAASDALEHMLADGGLRPAHAHARSERRSGVGELGAEWEHAVLPGAAEREAEGAPPPEVLASVRLVS